MQSPTLRFVVGLFIMALGISGILIKFDRMPGVHLGRGEVKFGGGGGTSGGGLPGIGLPGGGSTRNDSTRDDMPSEMVRGRGKPVSKAEGLRLGGLGGTAVRRVAIINNQTFAVGEMAWVELRGGPIQVLCKEIRPNSAVIQITGERDPMELFLDPGSVPASEHKIPSRLAGTNSAPPTGQTPRVQVEAAKVKVAGSLASTNFTGGRVDETTRAVEVVVEGQAVQVRP